MEVQGKIKLITPTESFGSSGFQKRNLVITTEEQYPQNLQLEFVQDKTLLLDNYQVGQDVKVGINLRGREWVNPQGEAKYFNSIVGWRIELLNQEGVQKSPPFEPQTKSNEDDDLPF